MDITKSSKKFCENISGGFSKEYFVLGMHSGEATEVYALTPEHSKRLLLWLGQQIANYEKQFGPIASTPVAPVLSPIQRPDLGQK